MKKFMTAFAQFAENSTCFPDELGLARGFGLSPPSAVTSGGFLFSAPQAPQALTPSQADCCLPISRIAFRKDSWEMIWTTAAPAVTTVFLSSLVEAVEALTIVLAVATVRGWRPAATGALAGLALLVLT
jgi:hypothetical protein